MTETESPHAEMNTVGAIGAIHDIDEIEENGGIEEDDGVRGIPNGGTPMTHTLLEGARSAVDGLPGDLGALPYEPDAPRTQTRLVATTAAKPDPRGPRVSRRITRARHWIRLRRA
ncbi:hypothetical protein ACIBSV_15530 [Embleya sp. NPDC050154]|uniref:hypothetical protein n=1 Tax=Embleya sp. NPDC050154 TaxID=3363988 RepID=UPI0037AF26A9